MRKTGRRILTMMLILAVALSLCAFPVHAASENATLKLTPVEAMPGEVFSTSLYITEDSEIAGIAVELRYDTDIVQLISAKGAKNVTVNSSTPGVVHINYGDQENTFEETTLVEFVFMADENVGPGSYPFVWRAEGDNEVATRLDGNDYLDVPIVCDFAPLNIFAAGDIDLNGKVEIRDVVHLRRYLARLETLTDYQLIMADAYADNAVNVRDAVYIQQYLAKFDVDPGRRANIYFYDADGRLYATKSVVRGEALSKTPAVPARTGYSNGAWSLSATEYAEPDFSAISKNMEVYAYYSDAPIIGDDEYEISYNLYNNDVYLQKVGVTNPNPEKYSSKDGLQLEEPIVDGYSFEGWFDGQGSNAKRVTEIAKGTTGKVTLYARWKPETYTINYVCSMGNIPSGQYRINENTALTVPTSELVPEMSNYIFLGWTDENGNLVNMISAGSVPANGKSVTFTANWTSRRNLTRPVNKLDDPIILEDTEAGEILFAYELGTIENVPLYEMNRFQSAAGIKVISSMTMTDSISTTNAESIAKSIAESTTNSQSWTLAEDWNNCTNVTESYAKQMGYTQEEANSLAKTSSNTFGLGISNGGSHKFTNTDTTAAKLTGTLSHEAEHTTEKGWELGAHADWKYNANASVGIDGLNVGGGYEMGGGISGKYHKTTTDKTTDGWTLGSEFSASNVKTDEWSSNWNVDRSFSASSSVSSSQTISQALSEIISTNKGYGKSYSEGGSRSENQQFATTNTSNTQYASTLTYHNAQETTTTQTYETNGSSVGSYRLICAGTIHVFGVVGYDVASQSYYTYTYNVLDDATHDFLDYSYDSTFNDFENSILPFEIPYYVHEYVTQRITKTTGLVVDEESGLITAYNGDSDVVVVPSYYVVDNLDGTFKSVKITGISSNAFKNNKDILAVRLNNFITEIPDSAFEGCTNLQAISCPGVVKFGDNAFKDCVSLNQVKLSTAVQKVGKDAFLGVKSVVAAAADSEVALACAQCGAKAITLNISAMPDPGERIDLVVPKGTDAFVLQGEKKVYENLKITSDANVTTLNGVSFGKGVGTPLQSSSETLNFEFVSIDSENHILLTADSVLLTLYGNSMITSASGKAIICKNLNVAVSPSAISNGIASKLRLSGDLLTCGAVTGQENLEFTSGEIVAITADTFAKYEKGMLIITFDANGGLLDATTMNAACFERVGKLPVPKKEGFSFLGWYTSLNPDEAEQVTEETVFEEVRDITVYAWWSENTWSDWTSSLPEGVDDTNYFTESKEQSRYRDKQTTTSTNASLSGWTRTGSSTSYGSWGSWSDWTVNSVGGSDTREVRTAQVYGYYYFRCPNCGAHSHDAYHCYTWNDGCGYSGNLTWVQMWSTTSWNSAGLVDPHGTSKPYTDNLGGGRWYKYPESGSPKTGYSYRDRSKTITYTYERWGDWSAWSDTIYSSSGTRQVETRTVYRYRLK